MPPLTAVPLVLLALALAAGSLLLRRRPAVRDASLAWYSRRIGLRVPDELRGELATRLARRGLVTDLGACAGLAGGATVAGLLGLETGTSTLVVLGGVLAGAGLGAGLVAVLEAVGPVGHDGPRVARVRAPAPSDYLAAVELVGARIVAVLPMVFVVVVTVAAVVADVGVDVVLAPWLVVVSLVPVAGLVAHELLARRLVDRPQPAGSSLELAWRDAVRARLLRDLVTMPIVLGSYATLGSLLRLSETVTAPGWRGVLAGALAVLLAGGVVVALVAAVTSPHRHFLRRLWPDGTDEVRSVAGVSPR